MLRLSSNYESSPDIAMVAALVGDPARSNMLTALMTGRALTASELATSRRHPQTAARIFQAGTAPDRAGEAGRHRYYRLTVRCRLRARGACGLAHAPVTCACHGRRTRRSPRADLL